MSVGLHGSPRLPRVIDHCDDDLLQICGIVEPTGRVFLTVRPYPRQIDRRPARKEREMMEKIFSGSYEIRYMKNEYVPDDGGGTAMDRPAGWYVAYPSLGNRALFLNAKEAELRRALRRNQDVRDEAAA